MKQKTFLKNVAVISLGGFMAKGIGALYRIPLSRYLGGYGSGLYQMAYPLFCVLLTFSSTGIPSAFSRIIARETARGQRTDGTVKTALKLFALLGLCGAAIMCLLAPYMSGVQGDAALEACYFALAPSVFLVALIAVLRGYFQGKNDMRPTAVSEIVEQLVKAGVGLAFAFTFREEPARAASAALFSVTLSELAALVYLLAFYRGARGRGYLRARRTEGSEIFAAALPVMLASAVLPLSQTVDSVYLVQLMSRHTTRAVSLYGLFAGNAITLVNLPAAVCYGLAAASVPAVSACFARGEKEEGRTRALYALALTLALSLPCAVGLFVLARPLVSILYGHLSAEDAQTLVTLLRLTSVSAVSLAGVDTLAACLTGMGRAKYAAFGMLVAVSVKLLVESVLVGDPAFSVAGAAIATNACYLVAFFFDLYYTLKRKTKREKKAHDYSDWLGGREGRFNGSGIVRIDEGGQGIAPHGEAAFRRRAQRSGN